MDSLKAFIKNVTDAEIINADKALHNKFVSLGTTPECLIEKASLSQIPLVISGRVVSKAVFDHGISQTKLSLLPELINQPKALFMSANSHQLDTIVVVSVECKQGSPIIIPIHKNKLIGRNVLCNFITSVYAKEGPDPVKKWIDEDLLIWQP